MILGVINCSIRVPALLVWWRHSQKFLLECLHAVLIPLNMEPFRIPSAPPHSLTTQLSATNKRETVLDWMKWNDEHTTNFSRSYLVSIAKFSGKKAHPHLNIGYSSALAAILSFFVPINDLRTILIFFQLWKSLINLFCW